MASRFNSSGKVQSGSTQAAKYNQVMASKFNSSGKVQSGDGK
jgi:hypothetical protein